MGKFINNDEKVLVNNYIDNYMSSIVEYAKFQNGTPTYVTYYSIDQQATTVDIGLGEVVHNIGSESPVKFNKILNLPLYGMSEIQPELGFEEDGGLYTDQDGNAIILADTIIPNINDYFIISYQNLPKLYKVNEFEVTTFSDKVYYKINFHADDSSIDLLEERQIQDIYEIVFENIGTEKNSVILRRDYLVLQRTRLLYDNLSCKYIKIFYDKIVDAFIYQDKIDEHLKYYDNCLTKFINNNSLFIVEKTLLTNINTKPYFESYKLDLEYEETIYYAIENGLYDYEYQYLSSNGSIQSSIFSLLRYKYNEFIHFPVDLENGINELKDLFSKEYLLEDILNKEIVSYKEIIQVFKYEYKKNFDMIITLIEKLKLKRNLEDFLLLPIILFILNEVEENLVTM